MKEKPMGMFLMMPTGRMNRLLRAAWRAPELLPKGRLVQGVNRVRSESFRILHFSR